MKASIVSLSRLLQITERLKEVVGGGSRRLSVCSASFVASCRVCRRASASWLFAVFTIYEGPGQKGANGCLSGQFWRRAQFLGLLKTQKQTFTLFWWEADSRLKSRLTR